MKSKKPTKTKMQRRHEGVVRFVKGVESNADSARDSQRVGRKSTGMSMHVKKMPTGSHKSKAARASGKAMSESSHKRRGGFNMSGMGESPEKRAKRAELMAKHGTLIVRVHKAKNTMAKIASGTKSKPHHDYSTKYKKTMTKLKSKISSRKKR